MGKWGRSYKGDRLITDNAVKIGGGADIYLHDTGDKFSIVVKDERPEISDSEIDYVFNYVLNPFYRIEASRLRDTGGVGPGLSVAHNIIDAHADEIILTNRPEGGLRVTIAPARGLDRKLADAATSRSGA